MSTPETIELHHLIAAVRSSREQVLAQVQGLSDSDGQWKPSTAEWSAAEIIEHLVLAEMAGVERIWRAANSDQRRADSPNRGLSIEQIVAATWKAKEQAPPNATPRGEGPLAFWASSLAAQQTVLDALALRLKDLDLELILFPHFLCGPLDARQRLEFLRFHLDRHSDQLARLAAQRSGSK